MSPPRVVVGVIGALIEVVLLRRIYRAPELFQLLATFALVLIINDATLYLWGPEDLLGPRAPGLRGAIEVLGRQLPSYDLFLIVIGAGGADRAAFCARRARASAGWCARRRRTAKWSARSASTRRCCSPPCSRSAPRSPASAARCRWRASRPISPPIWSPSATPSSWWWSAAWARYTGAYLAAVIIAEVKAICIGIGVVDFGFISVNFSKLTLVAEFLVMAAVLIARPYGLLGRAQAMVRSVAEPEVAAARRRRRRSRRSGSRCWRCCCVCRCWRKARPILLILGIDVLIAVIFAASLHFIAGPGGMHSFGHAAYFGLGAYGAALLVKWLAVPMGLALVAAPLVALAGALLFGWFAVRLSGVYLAMLTLAFAQIVWATVFQWEELTGGSNGVIGVWPPPPFDRGWVYYLLTLALAVIAVLLLRRFLFAPFGYAMRAGRDSALRAEAIGIDVKRVHWLGFAIAGAFAAWPADCSPLPRVRSRRRPSASAARSTAW